MLLKVNSNWFIYKHFYIKMSAQTEFNWCIFKFTGVLPPVVFQHPSRSEEWEMWLLLTPLLTQFNQWDWLICSLSFHCDLWSRARWPRYTLIINLHSPLPCEVWVNLFVLWFFYALVLWRIFYSFSLESLLKNVLWYSSNSWHSNLGKSYCPLFTFRNLNSLNENVL